MSKPLPIAEKEFHKKIWVYPGFSKQNGYTLQLQSREIFRARMGN
jgi:hypothetical protein